MQGICQNKELLKNEQSLVAFELWIGGAKGISDLGFVLGLGFGGEKSGVRGVYIEREGYFWNKHFAR